MTVVIVSAFSLMIIANLVSAMVQTQATQSRATRASNVYTMIEDSTRLMQQAYELGKSGACPDLTETQTVDGITFCIPTKFLCASGQNNCLERDLSLRRVPGTEEYQAIFDFDQSFMRGRGPSTRKFFSRVASLINSEADQSETAGRGFFPMSTNGLFMRTAHAAGQGQQGRTEASQLSHNLDKVTCTPDAFGDYANPLCRGCGGSKVCMKIRICPPWRVSCDPTRDDDYFIQPVSLARPASTADFHFSRNNGCALQFNGDVKCLGHNNDGQLGLGHDEYIGDDEDEMGSNLIKIDFGAGRRVVDMALSHNFNCFLLDNNELKCLGRQQQIPGATTDIGVNPAQLGDAMPSVELLTSAERTAGLRITDIDMSYMSLCALISDGQVRCFGNNDNNIYLHPHHFNIKEIVGVSLPTGRRALQIASGGTMHCMLLSGDVPQVKCFGNNHNGQLGTGNDENFGGGYYYDDEGTTEYNPLYWQPLGDNPAWVPVNLGRHILPGGALGPDWMPVKIFAGERNACAVNADGRVKCWGPNHSHQTGTTQLENVGDEPGDLGTSLTEVQTDPTQKVVTVAISELIACALLDNRRVQCWGSGIGATPQYTGFGGDVRSLRSHSVGGSFCATLTNGKIKCQELLSGYELFDAPSFGAEVTNVEASPWHVERFYPVEADFNPFVNVQ